MTLVHTEDIPLGDYSRFGRNVCSRDSRSLSAYPAHSLNHGPGCIYGMGRLEPNDSCRSCVDCRHAACGKFACKSRIPASGRERSCAGSRHSPRRTPVAGLAFEHRRITTRSGFVEIMGEKERAREGQTKSGLAYIFVLRLMSVIERKAREEKSLKC